MSDQFSNTTQLNGLQTASHTLINARECNGFLPKGCQDCGILHTCIDWIFLNLESLEERRLYNDIICVFKLFHGLFNSKVNDFFTLSHSSTREHALKIFKPCLTHSHVQHFFTYLVINLRNSLPDYVVCGTTLNSLKLKLHNFNERSYCKGRAFKWPVDVYPVHFIYSLMCLIEYIMNDE